MIAFSINDFKVAAKDSVIIDTRTPAQFTAGFIPDSIFIGLGPAFEEWVTTFVRKDRSILLVASEEYVEQSLNRLKEAGYDKVKGWLSGGFDAWKEAGEKFDMILDVEADELAMDIPFDPNLVVIDVRTHSEFAEGHVKDATNIPLAEMADLAQIASIDEDQNVYINCAGGYRSVIAASLLKKEGYHNIRNIVGGWLKISEEKNIPIEKDISKLN